MRSRSSTDHALPTGVGLAALLILGFTTCRTVFFADSGQLIAAARTLGVAHTPGYPLYTVLGRLALAIPLGEPAWRMNLLSALLGAATCACIAWLVARWTASPVAAAGAGLSLALSVTFWSWSTIAEVYTLQTLLVALLLAACAHAGKRAVEGRRARSAWLLAATALGLGLSHRPTIVLVLPAALALAWPALRRRDSRPSWRLGLAASAVVVALPALFYGTLVLRARAEPAVSFGRVVDLRALLDHVLAADYPNLQLGAAGWLRPEAWAYSLGLLWQGFGYVALPLAIVGVAACIAGHLGPKLRGVAVALLLLALPALLFGLTWGTSEVDTLFLPAAMATALAAGLGLATIERLQGRGARPLAVALAACAFVAPLLLNFPRCDRRWVTAAADYGHDMLSTVPADGVLFVEGDDAFVLAYLTIVSGLRPDVTIYDRTGNLFRDLSREPGPAPRPGESSAAYRMRREIELFTRELQRPGGRPVLFMTWPGYDPPPGLQFEPTGILYTVSRAGERMRDGALWEAYHAERVAEQSRRLGLPFAATVAAVYPLMRGERALFEGRHADALRWFDRVAAIDPRGEATHNYLGVLFARRGDYPRAVRQLEKVVAEHPVSVRAWNNLALARSLSGDHAGAREAWSRSLELQPLQDDVRQRLGR